jgi:hypothetical protein
VDLEEFAAKNKKFLAVIVIILVIGYFGLGYFGRLSIAPGFQGMQDGFNGYQPNGQGLSSLNNPLSPASGACSYSWSGLATISTADIHVTSPGGPGGSFGCVAGTGDDLVLNAQQNVIACAAFNTGNGCPSFWNPIPIKYYVCVPNTNCAQKQLVKGQVNAYSYNVVIQIQPGSAGAWGFKGDTIWLNLLSQNWNQLTTDPSTGLSGNAFEAPLYAVVQNVNWGSNGQGSNNLNVGPGSALVLYNSPGGGQSLVTLANNAPPSSALNSSLSSVYAPDSRMQRLVYYPIGIGVFQGCNAFYGCSNYPVATVTVTLYTLQIGEYIVTNPNTQGQGGSTNPNACSGLGCTFNQIAACFSLTNLFCWGSIAALGTIAVVVILLIVAGPTIVILVTLLMRRRDKET